MKSFLLLTTLSIAISLNGKQLDMGKISQDANWLVHMDFQSMRSSAIGTFIEESYQNISEVERKINEVQEKYGLNLMKTENLTMFGDGERHKGIGILEGGVDASIVNRFAQSKETIEASKMGKNTIFSTQKGRRPMAFAALKNGKMVFGPDRDFVSEGIFLAKNKGSRVSAYPMIESLNELMDNPCFVFFANMKGAKEVAELDQWVRLMTDKIDSCGMVIGDQDGGLKIIGLVQTNSIESSEAMENMIRGGVAMMDMKVKNDERMKNFLEGYKVVREGNIIRVEIELSNSLIIERIQKEMKKTV